jgi:malonate transporter and related proteins
VLGSILNVIAPVLLLGVFGFAATKVGYFRAAHREGLEKYVFDYAVPVLLFHAVVKLDTPTASTGALFAAYYLPLSAVFLVGAIAARWLLKRTTVEAIVIGLGACYSNSVLLGIPLVSRALGPDALLPLFLLISVHGISVFAVVTVLMEVAKGQGAQLSTFPKQVAKGLISNPLIQGLGAGFLWKATGLGLHPLVAEMFDLVATSVVPCALFVLGSSLATYTISGSVVPAILVTSIKNLLHPALVWLVGSWIGLERDWLAVAILLAAMPTGMTMYQFATRYQVAPPVATTCIFVSTVSGIGTLSIVIALIAGLP